MTAHCPSVSRRPNDRFVKVLLGAGLCCSLFMHSIMAVHFDLTGLHPTREREGPGASNRVDPMSYDWSKCKADLLYHPTISSESLHYSQTSVYSYLTFLCV